ncbi:helix-turn-helix domain-containing protein [Flagellimonas myxillae]|uniref:helix-turn-helix domain-containing protein n=1 Tax=Flagellimonas myxillae TaxID=2942214 RepID=UPI00201F7692|nr:helix-turn-helix transcriptional regulator [Muricauda myxillae]MCL6267312.1 helix-turn-helix domain-containing protein [Muricauda myxillae]
MHVNYTERDRQIIKKLGERVRQLRIEKGLSQFYLGIDADVNKNQIGRIERAERNTSIVTLSRIADALEIPLSSLFLFDE